MADRFFAIDDQTFLFPQQVRDAYLTDIQTRLNQGVTDAIAGIPNVAQAVADKLAPLTADTAVSPLLTGSSATRNALPYRYLTGSGIDLTGSSDSTTAVQNFLNARADGDTVVVPSGAIIRITSGLTISKRIRLTGTGELRWAGGTGVLITITTDGVTCDGLNLTNPTAAATIGILAKANIFTATGNRVTGMQDGIAVSATGEYHDIVIANNQIIDIIGSGDGPSSGSSNGESNGDGIVVWGAAATIVGNRVTCKTGRDARIGIHVESLGSQATTPYVHANSLTTVVGNVITGQFRRGIVDEGVTHTVIADNVIADATWWGIAVIGLAHHTIVSTNTIKYTRTSSDNQGSVATPLRCGVMLYCIQEPLTDVAVVNNTIRAVSTATMPYGIVLQAHTSVTSNAANSIQIMHNRVWDESATTNTGISITAATTGVQIDRNLVSRFTANGINVFTGTELTVTGNRLNGPGTGSNVYGIQVNGGAADARIDGNIIRDVQVGIAAFFRSILTTVNGNTIRNASVGIDLYQSTDTAAVNSNVFYNVATRRQNLPVNTVQVGNAPS